MAGSVNKVILVGNLGRDPEIRTMQTGGRVANLSVATSESWKDKTSGERREKTEWHRVVIFNDGIVGVAENYLSKGAKVYIEGQIETRKWQDNQGKDQYTTEIVVRPYKGELTMLDSRSGGSRASGGMNQVPDGFNQDQKAVAGGGSQAKGGSNPFGSSDGGNFEDLDDDIPF